MVIFQKVYKVINKAFPFLGTTMKLTNEDIATQENLFVYFTRHQQKLKRFQGSYECYLRQNKHILRIFLQQKNHWFSRYVSFRTTILKLRCVYQTKKDMEGNSKQQDIHSIITDVPPAPNTVMNLVKCNCKKSNRRLGKCICKKGQALLYSFICLFVDLLHCLRKSGN